MLLGPKREEDFTFSSIIEHPENAAITVSYGGRSPPFGLRSASGM